MVVELMDVILIHFPNFGGDKSQQLLYITINQTLPSPFLFNSSHTHTHTHSLPPQLLPKTNNYTN
jgi:hypothetical protein